MDVILSTTLFTISNSGIDTYTIVGPTRASSTGFGGGDTILASYNRKYEKLYAQIPYLQVSGTKIDTFVQTTDVVPVDSNTTNYKSYNISEMETTFLNQEHYFLNQKMISSKINEVINNVDNSLLYKIGLSSTSSHLSPLIDLRNASVKTISNRVEKKTNYTDMMIQTVQPTLDRIDNQPESIRVHESSKKKNITNLLYPSSG